MTDNRTPSEQPKKETPPTSPPSAAETKKGTQPLNNPDSGHQKPPSKLDAETQERLRKMLGSRLQPSSAEPAEKPKPASTQAEKKDPAAAGPAAAPGKTPTSPAPASKDAAGAGEKSPSWPEPAKNLGGPSTPDKPAPEPADPASSAATARLNQPTAEPAPRSKAEAQAAIRTTSATRNVPKGRVAQEVWKVIFQGLAGTETKELGIEVKGLSVVGRADPDGDSKADLDLSSFNAASMGVSRQHVILIPTDEGPCIIDMNSTNGTWINGLYLEPGRRYRLRTNDRVELGSLKLLVRVMTPAEAGAASEGSSQPPAADAKKPDTP